MLVPEMVPTMAVPYEELPVSLYATTNLPAVFGSKSKTTSCVAAALNLEIVPKDIVVPETVPTTAYP